VRRWPDTTAPEGDDLDSTVPSVLPQTGSSVYR